MTTARTSDLWWKNAVVYCLDVETFLDWDGDGVGDIRGLTERIDYLAGIGVSCTMRAVPLLGAIRLWCPSAHRTR
jgi:hypothetical protein